MKKINQVKKEMVLDLFNSKLPARESLKAAKIKRELLPVDIEFIKMVYKQIMDGQATRSNITKAHYLITQDNVQEHHRMTAIINFIEHLN